MDMLDGIRVLSFNHFLLGPVGTQVLADLGADVITVEPTGGSFQRTWGGANRKIDGETMLQLCGNRNKRNLAIDLKAPQGRSIIEAADRHRRRRSRRISDPASWTNSASGTTPPAPSSPTSSTPPHRASAPTAPTKTVPAKTSSSRRSPASPTSPARSINRRPRSAFPPPTTTARRSSPCPSSPPSSSASAPARAAASTSTCSPPPSTCKWNRWSATPTANRRPSAPRPTLPAGIFPRPTASTASPTATSRSPSAPCRRPRRSPRRCPRLAEFDYDATFAQNGEIAALIQHVVRDLTTVELGSQARKPETLVLPRQ